MSIFETIEIERLKVVKLALLQHKKKYIATKKGPEEFDCSGLVWYLYKTLYGININYLGIGQSMTTKQMTSSVGQLKLIKEKEGLEKKKEFIIEQVNPGDVLFFHRQAMNDHWPTYNNHYPGHVGISLGEFKFIQASFPRREVLISDFEKNEYWYEVLVGSKDIIKEIVLKKRD